MAEEEGALSKLKNSVMGVLLGLVMIPGSFVVVYYASQRLQASEELEGAYSIEQLDKAKSEKKAVYATGTLKAAPLGEPGFVKPGNYLSLHKSVQMYAYKNVSKTRTVNDKKETYYVCEKDWVSNPETSAKGEDCAKRGMYNPGSSIAEFDSSVIPTLTAGSTTYTLSPKGLGYADMPSVNLTEADMEGNYALSDGKFYESASCQSSPTVGCERFTYSGTAYDPAGTYTVIGSVEGSTFSAFGEGEFLRVGAGKYEDVMGSLNSSDTTMTWVLWAISVALLGGGLSLLVGPLLTLIEFIPIIGDLGAGLIRFVFFVFAAVVMGIVFLLIEYWYLVLALFVIAVIAIIFIAKGRKSKAAA